MSGRKLSLRRTQQKELAEPKHLQIPISMMLSLFLLRLVSLELSAVFGSISKDVVASRGTFVSVLCLAS